MNKIHSLFATHEVQSLLNLIDLDHIAHLDDDSQEMIGLDRNDLGTKMLDKNKTPLFLLYKNLKYNSFSV